MQAMPTRIFLVLFILILLILPSALLAATEQRIALIIGNSAYSSGPLKNPVNDAAAMATQLQNIGFTVILKKDANLRGMEDALTDFGDRLKRGGVGLFFYAGHGLQVGGTNYLVPIGARINREADIKYETLDAGKVLDEMATANNGLNIVIFDACRDNPYSRSFRNASRGLAIVSNAPVGTFISYSTSPGNVASDGDGRNSPYTEALLRYMKEPGLTIEQVFKGARAMLGKETGGKQIPWELSSLQGEFYFVPGSGTAATAITQPGKIVTDRDESSAARKPDTDALDDESRKLEDEERQLEKEQALLEKKKSIGEKRQKIEEEKAALEAKKNTTVAMGKRPSIRHWAESARASSQYGNPDWSATQATGEPNTFKCGDLQSAWATRAKNAGHEWIELTYAREINANAVIIYQTFNPGAVVGIDAQLSGVWTSVWSGVNDDYSCPNAITINFSRPVLTKIIRIQLNTARVDGWNEIDAVALVEDQPRR